MIVPGQSKTEIAVYLLLLALAVLLILYFLDHRVSRVFINLPHE